MNINSVNSNIINNYSILSNNKIKNDVKKTNYVSSNNVVRTNPLHFSGSIISPYLRSDVINYLNTNPKPLAQGTDGVVYKLGNNAIKVGKYRETSFDGEAEILKKLPGSLSTSQKFVDRFQYNDRDVLVSTFVEGEHKKSLEGEDFDKLFDVILQHDNAGIIHGDLNVGNIIFSPKGDISFIDYGIATIENGEKLELYPSFVKNTNVLKFENTGLCDSMKVWAEEGQIQEKFSQYLAKKADFYSHHKYITSSQAQHDYEENLSRVYEKPDKDVVLVELMRLKTLDLLEEADTMVNYKNLPQEAIETWNRTVEQALQYMIVTEQLMNSAKDVDEKTYFENQNQIARSFHETLSSWAQGTINWLYAIKEPNFKPTSDVEKNLKNNWQVV